MALPTVAQATPPAEKSRPMQPPDTATRPHSPPEPALSDGITRFRGDIVPHLSILEA